MTASILLGGLLAASPALAQAEREPGETCTDGRKNGPEGDVDCGGDCRACRHGRACTHAIHCASGLCAEGACAERPHVPSLPVPEGYRVTMSRHDGAASVRRAGALFFALAYGAAYGTAVSAPRFASSLYVPLVGPWVALDRTEYPAAKGALIADGALQAMGAVLLITGIIGAGEQLIREEPSAAASVPASRRIALEGTSLRLRF